MCSLYNTLKPSGKIKQLENIQEIEELSRKTQLLICPSFNDFNKLAVQTKMCDYPSWEDICPYSSSTHKRERYQKHVTATSASSFHTVCFLSHETLGG